MGAKKRMRKRVLRHMMDGTISVNQARAMLGKDPLPAPRRATGTYRAPRRQGAMAAKSAGQARAPGASVPGRSALEWMAETYSDPMLREPARTRQYGLDSNPRSWSPPPPGLVREAETSPDPRERERARGAIQKSMTGPEKTTSASVRGLVWGTGPGGEPGWQIAGAGTAGR
jgi:hypothetical protein